MSVKLPVLSLGHPLLRKSCESVNNKYPNLNQMIEDMWETMLNANGCGLAAPQIGHPIKLFVVDSKSTYESLGETDKQTYFDDSDKGITETFLNAQIIERSQRCWEDEEGCLSIPDLSQTVKRHWEITVEYYNKNFEKQTRTYSGTTARIIQHEYDHTNGVLYIDHLNPLTRKLIDSKLKKIIKGQIKGYLKRNIQ